MRVTRSSSGAFVPRQETMSVPNRRRWLVRLLLALGVLAAVAVLLATLSSRQSIRRAALAKQQVAVEALRQRGGTVLLGPPGSRGLPPDVIGVDLSRAVVDAEVMRTLGQYTLIQRLSLDGARLQPQDWALVGKLPQLQSLSLARSNITDADVPVLPPGLTKLSLNGTAVTDKSMSHLATISGLISLDITDTAVTGEGLRLLEPLQSLQKLSIDDSCITASSAESLRLMQPQSMEVAVSDGLGRSTYELLSVCKGTDIRGHYRNEYTLWTTDSAWSDTLAGVVEAVVLEIGLDSQQATELQGALGNQAPPLGSWAPPAREPPPSLVAFSYSSRDSGARLASAGEFIRELQKPRGSGFDYWAVCRFAKEKFKAGDVPQLLAAMRATPYSRGDHLYHFGPFLLVHHGVDDPEVLAELDRLLAHQESFVRLNTICAFAYGGARPFYSRDEWTASQAADDFAVPRLVRICHDRSEFKTLRESASMVLGEIAQRRPRYAAEVLSVLVDLLDEEGPWHYRSSYYRHSQTVHILQVDIPRLAELDAEAALAVVPRLRQMLTMLDEQLAGAPAASLLEASSPNRALHQRRISLLAALSAIAGQDSALAHELDLEYLTRMEDGQFARALAILLSPATPEANRKAVLALLPSADQGELGTLAKKIRDWQAARQRADEPGKHDRLHQQSPDHGSG
jgi:hypothetical protein